MRAEQPLSYHRDYVIALEDLNFMFSKEQLTNITKLHTDGMEIEDIAKEVNRDAIEVLIALIHQAKKGHMLPPFAYRRSKDD